MGERLAREFERQVPEATADDAVACCGFIQQRRAAIVNLGAEIMARTASNRFHVLEGFQAHLHGSDGPGGRRFNRRRNWAFTATMRVDTLIANAPTLMGRSTPHRTKRPAAGLELHTIEGWEWTGASTKRCDGIAWLPTAATRKPRII